MLYFEKSRAGRFNLALAIRLYGGPTTWMVLSDRAVRPSASEAILVVNYKTHHIEDFHSMRAFVMAYPFSPPIEYTREVVAAQYPRIPRGE